MKILMVTPYFWPKIGGLENYAFEVANRLAARGHDVHVVASGMAAETKQVGELTVHYLPVMLSVSNTPIHPMWPVQLRRVIKNFKPDVINVHAPVPSLALVALLVAGRTPLVTTYHAGSMKKGSFVADQLIAVYERLFLPLLLRRSQTVIAASQYVNETFLAHWKEKTVVITPGVDTDKFIPSGAKRATGRVLFIGDFRDPRKGLEYLREATLGLPQAHLRVVGAGTPVVQPRVSYLGELRGQALINEIQTASVLVLPSITNAESFGMVLLEAMACGVPVIATTAGGPRYVVNPGETGYLVPPANAAALSQMISDVLADRAALAVMGVNGRATAVRDYSWDDRAVQTEEVLVRAISKPALQTEVRHG